MEELLWEPFLDALLDTARLLPFLFITYVLMEYLEHRTGDRTLRIIRRADRLGPMFGGVLGVIPQCGFSAAASSFYAGRVITAGTLIAVYLSTSDEMLPIMVSSKVNPLAIAGILAIKAIYGMIAGFLIDFLFRKFNERKIGSSIRDLCAQDDCHCNDQKADIWKSSIKHTLQTALFLFVISFLLSVCIALIGEEGLKGMILNQPVIGEIIAGLIGLIPNCAASVAITSLYMEGAMGTGAMLAGLLTGAGVGIPVLFRNNRSKKECLQLMGLLYICGVAGGLLADLCGLVIL